MPNNKTLALLATLSKENNFVELEKVLKKESATGIYLQDFRHSDDIIVSAARDALLAGYEEVVRLLFQAGLSANSEAFIKGSDHQKNPLIYFAVLSGKLNMVQLSVEYGAEIYTEEGYSEAWNDNCALRTAVQEKHAHIVDYLLSCGADVDALCSEYQGSGDASFLEKSAEGAQDSIVESLVNHGADPVSTIVMAHQNIYVAKYQKYATRLKSEFSETRRIEFLVRAFADFFQDSPKFNVNYCLTPEAEHFFAKFNSMLSDVKSLKANPQQREKSIDSFKKRLAKKFAIEVSNTNELKSKFNRLLDALEDFDTKKMELQQKAQECSNAYTRIIRTCLEYGIGCDFEEANSCMGWVYGGLTFLGDLDVAGMNFIGVSVAGHPVTREQLKRESKLGFEKAIVSTNDLIYLSDNRKNKILNRLKKVRDERGVLLNEDGVDNLVPLPRAAKIGDEAAVKTRILAGVDPNIAEGTSLVLAAKNGHSRIVNILQGAHGEHSANQPKRLLETAKQFLTQNPNVNSLFVAEGKLQSLTLPFTWPDCQVFIIKRKKFTQLMEMRRKYLQALTSHIQTAVEEAAKENHSFVIGLNKEGKFKHLVFKQPYDREDLKKDLRELIRSSTDSLHYYPAIFSSKDNLELIEVIIEMQYQAFDKGKTSEIKAIESARENNHPTIVRIIEDTKDPNELDAEGNNFLHKAIVDADVERVLYLIKNGANVNLENRNGETPLIIAAKYTRDKCASERYIEIINILLEHKADPNNYGYRSPLDEAMEAGNVTAVSILLPITKKKALIRKDVSGEIVGQDLWYVDLMLMALYREESIELLRLLKENGADFNKKILNGNSTLLCQAVLQLPCYSDIQSGMRNVVSASYRDDVEQAQNNFNNKLKVIDYLLTNGADLTVANEKGNTPLDLLSQKDLHHIKTAFLLIRSFHAHATDVNMISNEKGNTFLHEAVRVGDSDTVEYLIKQGASVNAQNKELMTPLHLAAAQGCEDSVLLLLKHGADHLKRNKEGLTAIELAEKAFNPGMQLSIFKSFKEDEQYRNRFLNIIKIIKEFDKKMMENLDCQWQSL